VAKQGRAAWAFLGLSEKEGAAAADGALAFGLIWVDWLRSQAKDTAVTQLKLFLPPAAVSVIAHRAAYLDPRALSVEIYEWRAGQPSALRVDLKDYGNVETHLAPRRQAELLKESHTRALFDLLGELGAGLDIFPDSTGTFSSLRYAGLEVARLEGQLAPRIYFGLEGNVRRLDESCRDAFRDLVHEVRGIRCAASSASQHEFYRLQSERWLESLLFRDISRIDPALSPEHVYPQVPAFSGTDRGVIDLLTATRRGRLAVVELKVQEEINLPLQGLDYWLRVNWLQKRNQFREYGYFQDCELSAAAPLLYLVSPAFRFHSTTEKLLAYFDRKIEVVLIGINDTWRKDIKVLFRHLTPGSASL
jgi:DNA-binding transcriptional ArsR family regulator